MPNIFIHYLFASFVACTISALIGAYYDIKKNVEDRSLYWQIGFIGGWLTGLVPFVAWLMTQ